MKGKQKDGLCTGTVLVSLEVGPKSRILIQVVSERVLSGQGEQGKQDRPGKQAKQGGDISQI